MRIDIILDPSKTVTEFVELGQLAESLNFGAVWMPNKPNGRDPFSSFAVLAQSTSRIRMGPIAISPFELHPMKMATCLLSLNEISNGRAVIVVGAGGGTMEAMGVWPERPVRAVRECIDILKTAAKGKKFDYRGEIYKVSRFEPLWVKAEQPQIYVGANKEQMFRMSARSADGIMMSDVPLPIVSDLIDIAHETLAKKGRSKTAFPINNFFAWHVKKDKEDALREARRWLVLRGLRRTEYLEPFLSPEDLDLVRTHLDAFITAWRNNTHIIEGVPDRIVNALVDGLTLWGDTNDLDRIIDELKQFEEKGLTQIALRVYEDPAGCIRLIGEKVIPALS